MSYQSFLAKGSALEKKKKSIFAKKKSIKNENKQTQKKKLNLRLLLSSLLALRNPLVLTVSKQEMFTRNELTI